MGRQSQLNAEEEAILKRVLSMGEMALLKDRRARRHRAGLEPDAYDDGELLPAQQRTLDKVVSQEKVLLALGVGADDAWAEVLYRAVLCGDVAGACLEAGVAFSAIEEWRRDPAWSRLETLATGDLHRGYLRLALGVAAREGASRRDIAPLQQLAQAAMPEEFRGRARVQKPSKGRLAAAMEGG